jgi:hypothetical protein
VWLSLPRVLALVGGLALVAAFYMPWFGSQGLLLSGQFLHNFLANASPADLRRFLPNSSASEVQMLRVLVDLFPACGVVAAGAALVGGLVTRGTGALNVVLGLSGLLPLVALLVGVGRLPAGSSIEVGLWLIGGGSVAVLVGLAFELALMRGPIVNKPFLGDG